PAIPVGVGAQRPHRSRRRAVLHRGVGPSGGPARHRGDGGRVRRRCAGTRPRARGHPGGRGAAGPAGRADRPHRPPAFLGGRDPRGHRHRPARHARHPVHVRVVSDRCRADPAGAGRTGPDRHRLDRDQPDAAHGDDLAARAADGVDQPPSRPDRRADLRARRRPVPAPAGPADPGGGAMTSRPEGHPLTVAQQEIWAYSTLYGADHRYLVAGYVHLHGRIDPDLFDRALRHVVTGVETLRVRLDTEGPEPRQVVSPCPERITRRADFASHPDPLAAGLAHLRSVTAPYDLTTATTLSDHHLVDIGEAGFLWGLRAHHLILDGGGSLALVRAVADTYTALATGAPPPDYAETVADYVAEEQRYRSSRRYADDREFWRERLAGLGDAPEFTHPPAAPGSHGPLRHRGSPSAEEARAVEEAARRHGVGTAALLGAAVALALHADSGARTVVLGMAVPAKRSWRAFGMTSNLVGLRLEIDPCAPVGELVRATQREMATVLRHQHFRRFDLLAAEISPGVEHRVFGPALNFLP